MCPDNKKFEPKINRGYYKARYERFEAEFTNTPCDNLKRAVAKTPVSVAIDANEYFGAKPFTTKNTPFNYANHDVLLVGYTPKYWII